MLKHYSTGVQFPHASGFEILEVLDTRSRLAEIEKQLAPHERAQLERADREFLAHAADFYASISTIASLPEMRARAGALPSHWWWYLDELVHIALAA